LAPKLQPWQGEPGHPSVNAHGSNTGSSSSSSSSSSGVGLWAVPRSDSSKQAAGRDPVCGAPGLTPELQQLVNRLMHYPRSSSSSSSVGGVFSRVMSEGEWLRSAERVWDDVQDSRVLLQYYRALAEARLVGAGGWV
jgi:hypothetical protein